jgi:hypothetical protein
VPTPAPTPTPTAAPGAPAPAAGPSGRDSASYEREIADLRQECAQRRTALRTAEEQVSSLEAQLSARDERIRELEAQLDARDSALAAELDRRLATVPEDKRHLVAGQTVSDRLAHLASMQAAGVFSTPVEPPPAPLPPNPLQPGPPQRDPVEAPRTYQEWARWPTEKAKQWKQENPEAYEDLRRTSGRY